MLLTRGDNQNINAHLENNPYSQLDIALLETRFLITDITQGINDLSSGQFFRVEINPVSVGSEYTDN
jgi:hypothetical protein